MFLGYPISDVKGFLENAGQNSKFVGCWKVYSDEYKANKLFKKYNKYTNVYSRKLIEGLSVSKLTVAEYALTCAQ